MQLMLTSSVPAGWTYPDLAGQPELLTSTSQQGEVFTYVTAEYAPVYYQNTGNSTHPTFTKVSNSVFSDYVYAGAFTLADFDAGAYTALDDQVPFRTAPNPTQPHSYP